MSEYHPECNDLTRSPDNLDMSEVNFSAFTGSSSHTEALLDFVDGILDLDQLQETVWEDDALAEMGQLQELGERKARKLAHDWCLGQGYGVGDLLPLRCCPLCGSTNLTEQYPMGLSKLDWVATCAENPKTYIRVTGILVHEEDTEMEYWPEHGLLNSYTCEKGHRFFVEEDN